MKWVRNLYDWVLSWAETPYGSVALFVLAVAESSFFPIPPDVLLVALCVGKRAHALRFALICTAGSVVGGVIGYGIGWGAWAAVDQLFYTYVPGFTEAKFHSVGDLYEQYNFWVVFIAAFTPIPYKVITIAAGVFHVSFPMFVVASLIGRAARFYLVAGLLYHYGEPIKGFIDKWFNLLVVAFTVLLVGGFALLKYAH
ncbi:MAG: DedA family protein [Candidatus Hydrogenedentes bacterium]|nr:DedA family protein [Candidatus Hydrogenedentota bacterium]